MLNRVCLLLLLSPFALLAGEAVDKQTGVPYLGPDRREQMDVYLPPAAFRRPVPAVVFIHGGGWSGGSRADQRSREFCETLAAHGFAAFSIDYRLNVVEKSAAGKSTVREVAWPQNFFDCKSAVRYVRAHAEAFGIDSSRIAVMGASAGAHLALLVAATKNSERWNAGGLHTGQSNEISAVVEFYGRYDVSRDRRAQFAGTTEEQTGINAADASPSTHLTSEMPPVLIVQGDADTIVPVRFGRELAERLAQLGVEHETIEIPGAEHSFGWEAAGLDLRPRVVAFLEKHLGKPRRD